MRIFIVSEKSCLKEIQVGKLLRKPYPYQSMTYTGNDVSKWTYKLIERACIDTHKHKQTQAYSHTKERKKNELTLKFNCEMNRV